MASHGSDQAGLDGAKLTADARNEQLGLLLERSLELPRESRASFVEVACGGDVSLRDEVMSLLHAHDAAGEYLDDLHERVVGQTLSAMARRADEASETMMQRLQASLVARYRLERELGGAGMSRVFVAEDLKLRRRVVIKALPPGRVPTSTAERLGLEIALAAQLQHSHIVPLLEADTVDGMLYYTMPFVSGESLRDRLSREGPLPVHDAVRIWRDVLDALGHAHMSGVVHRDIKPGNILLSGRNALVTDFGIARAIEAAAAGLTPRSYGPVIGTPAYMSPEQAAGGQDVDPRADIYQAALVMYEMLNGALPFAATSTHDLLLARLARNPEPLCRPGVPSRLASLVMRCLALDPRARPASADDVIAELEVSIDDDAAPARPVDGATRRRARNLALIATAGAALAALMLPAVRRPEPAAIGAAVTPPAASIAVLPLADGGESGTRRIPDIAAYEWYLRGMNLALLRSDSGLAQGIDFFQRAIAIDPTFAAAYAGLSQIYLGQWNKAHQVDRADLFARSEQAALRAVGVDDSDAEAWAALGWVRVASRDYAVADTAFTRALAIDDHVSRGYEGRARTYMMLARPVDQLGAARRGLEADALSHSAIREMALALATNGRCQESLDQLQRLKNLTPPAGVAGVLAGQCYASRQMWSEAITELQWARGTSEAAAALAFLGHALARDGRLEAAERILSDLLSGREESHGSFGIAIVYAGMRDYDQAFAWLHRSIDDDSFHAYIMHPVFSDLHRDPRFERVREGVGIGKL